MRGAVTSPVPPPARHAARPRPRRPAISPRSRTRSRIATVLLSLAVVAGAGLPASVAAADPATDEQPAAEAVTTSVVTGDLRLDREQAQLAREHVERIMAEQPDAFAALDGMRAEAATARPNVVRFAGADRYATAASFANHYWGSYFWNPKNGPVGWEKVLVVASGADFADALSGGAAAAAWGGPLLLTRQAELPSATRASIELLRPDAILVLGGTGAVSTKVEGELREYAGVTRVDGTDRYAVSAALAERIGYSQVAYVANGRDFPDGLAGGAAAGRAVAPLLITRPDGVPGPVMNVLRTEVLPADIYVLGGTGAVQEAVLTQLRAGLPGVRVHRVSGGDRYEVAARVATHHPTEGMATIASGQDWPDALAGSALAGLIGSKLLLVRQDGVPGATQQALRDHSLVNIDALGGSAKIEDSVLTFLRNMDIPTG